MVEHAPGFLALVNAARSRIAEVDAARIPEILAHDSAAVLVDTREDSEWQAGHIRGAVHLGKGIIERDIEALYPDKGRPLYLYCGGGFRSALVADNLAKMGYERAISVAGGWRRLKEILPTE